MWAHQQQLDHGARRRPQRLALHAQAQREGNRRAQQHQAGGDQQVRGLQPYHVHSVSNLPCRIRHARRHRRRACSRCASPATPRRLRPDSGGPRFRPARWRPDPGPPWVRPAAARGRFTKARARPRRWRSPVDSSRTSACSFGRQPQPLHQPDGGGSVVRGHAPPARLGLAQNDLAAPFVSRHARTRRTVEFDFALAGVQVGDLTQQQGLARARRPHHRRALAGRQRQIDGGQPGAAHRLERQSRPHVSHARGLVPAAPATVDARGLICLDSILIPFRPAVAPPARSRATEQFAGIVPHAPAQATPLCRPPPCICRALASRRGACQHKPVFARVASLQMKITPMCITRYCIPAKAVPR